MEYRFTIADSFTPETLPMERLGEYVAALAKLLGEQANVHFRGIEAGSAVLVASIDPPAQPKVRERVLMVRDGGGPSDARNAFADLDEMLRKDNATGTLSDGPGGVIIPFPGRNRPEPPVYGPFREDGTIDGQLIRVGGKDETVPVHLRDGAIIHTGIVCTPGIAAGSRLTSTAQHFASMALARGSGPEPASGSCKDLGSAISRSWTTHRFLRSLATFARSGEAIGAQCPIRFVHCWLSATAMRTLIDRRIRCQHPDLRQSTSRPSRRSIPRPTNRLTAATSG